ncbi:hypothetical protein RND81_12G158200 [Saponaria officinalis]|uniref:DUF3511 domain protein n=1 Tax=Saponaria officinalis TaxID=3572 RepID=A0AAW1HB33_SAPOF
MNSSSSPQKHSYGYGGDRRVELYDINQTTRVDQMYVARSRAHCPPSGLRKAPQQQSSSMVHSVKAWYNNPEQKRKRRVAKYKIYSIEGKMKASFKKGFRWFKRKCSRVLHGH